MILKLKNPHLRGTIRKISKMSMNRKRGLITAERYRRLHALNPIFAADNYVLEELAARFGVGVDVIIRDRDYIHTHWWAREESEATLGEREKQVEMYKMLRSMALEAYKRSKQDKEEVTTRYDDKLCEDCNGTGRLPMCKCLNCDGTGHVTEEIVQRKVSGSPGDPAFIREARACTDSICKLLGLNKPVVERIQHHVDHNHNHIVKLESKYADADPEDILAAKAAFSRLEESAKRKTIEGKVVGEGDE